MTGEKGAGMNLERFKLMHDMHLFFLCPPGYTKGMCPRRDKHGETYEQQCRVCWREWLDGK